MKEDEIMIKNKVLTPVLAGILGVSVVGSGVGYYFVNKDGNNGVKPEETMDSLEFSLAEVENTVNDTVTDVEKAVKGELDYAYDSNLKISFGNGAFSNSTGSQYANVSVKPIEINTSVKQKGQNTSADISAVYNDVTIATLETVYARDSKTAYFRIPEISSSYIKATEEDLKKAFEDTAKKYTEKYNSKNSANGSTSTDKKTSIETPDLKNLTKNLGLPDLSSVDSKKLEEKLKAYAELVESKLPAKKDNGTVTGEIDGNKYDYKVSTYSITGKQFQEIFNAVIDKMAGDADLKKYYEDFMSKNNTSSAKKTYDDFIKELKKEIVVSEKDQKKEASFDIYYDGENVTGCSLNYDGKNYVKAVFVSKSDVNAVEVSLHDDDSKEIFSAKGSVKLTDGKMSGTYALKMAVASATFSGTLTLDKVVIKDDYFNGTIKFDITSDQASASSGKKQSFSVSLSGKATSEDKDLTFSVDANDQNMIKIEFNEKKTEATDVEIPTGKTFTLDQLEQYKATCDFEQFKNNISSAIGTDIFGSLGTLSALGGMYSSYTVDPAPENMEYYSF